MKNFQALLKVTKSSGVKSDAFYARSIKCPQELVIIAKSEGT
ncbi:hypothetical protein ACXOLH_13930 [Streptococcus thermophilus]